jgi:WD40 repeat protein
MVKLLQTSVLHGHKGWGRHIAFSPFGNVFASCSDDGTICIWSYPELQLLQQLSSHDELEMTSVQFFNCSQYLLSSSRQSNDISIWDLQAGRKDRHMVGHESSIENIVIHPTLPLAASASFDGTIGIWDIENAILLRRLFGHSGPVLSVAFHPTANMVISAGEDAVIRMWNYDSGQCIAELIEHTDWVESLEVSSDGRFLASASHDGQMILWDLELRQKHWQHVAASFVRSVTFSRVLQCVAFGTESGAGYLYRVPNGELIATLRVEASRCGIQSIASSPKDKVLITGSQEPNSIQVWKA